MIDDSDGCVEEEVTVSAIVVTRSRYNGPQDAMVYNNAPWPACAARMARPLLEERVALAIDRVSFHKLVCGWRRVVASFLSAVFVFVRVNPFSLPLTLPVDDAD